MRALLDLLRDNEAVVKEVSAGCKEVLRKARVHLKILDPEHGEAELIKSVAVELAMLLLPLRKSSTLHPKPETRKPTLKTRNPNRSTPNHEQ